jgi:hypothetical protein
MYGIIMMIIVLLKMRAKFKEVRDLNNFSQLTIIDSSTKTLQGSCTDSGCTIS